MSQKSRISVYACGGAGVNLATKLIPYTDEANDTEGYAVTDVVMIDTSQSNLRNKDYKKESVYLVEGLDGSGKVRADNHKKIAECVTDILHNHPPGELSIVLSSLSGGSGSVIAPSIASELLRQKRNVVVVAIASSESRIELENSIKTLKSYESVSKQRERPLSMYYLENSATANRSANDREVLDVVLSLLILFSGQNHELDTADLTNWLNYDHVTSFSPKLMYISNSQGSVSTEKSYVVSVATLAEMGGEEGSVEKPEYRCVGYVPTSLTGDTDGSGKLSTPRIGVPFHYVILDGVIKNIFNELNSELQRLDEAAKARRRKVDTITDSDDEATDDGLIL